MGNPEIVHFAQNVLGCGCDSSVFESIESIENTVLECGIELLKKIVIGHRLLIYIADAENLKINDLKNVIVEGMTERDRMNYNRLRVAVVTPDVKTLTPLYLDAFEHLTGKDLKTHIHVVSDRDAVL